MSVGLRWFFTIALCFALTLIIGCGGGGGTDSPTGSTAGQEVRGVWSGDVDETASKTVAADLALSAGRVSGFLTYTEGAEVYSGAVSGQSNSAGVQFTAQLEGHPALTFQSDGPLTVGSPLSGTFRFGNLPPVPIRLNHDNERTIDVSGEWQGTWQSAVLSTLKGTWSGAFTQDGHHVSGHGTVGGSEQRQEFTISGTVVGRRFVAALAVAGERPVLWRALLNRHEAQLAMTGHYNGRMTATEGPDEGTLNGTRAGAGGGTSGDTGRIHVRPAELRLAPGDIETFTASRGDIVWSQSSTEAQPGTFVEGIENRVRFQTPLIGGHILIKATAAQNEALFGVSHLLVTGARGHIGEHRFRTVHGASSALEREGAVRRVIEIPTERGAFRLVTPEPTEPGRHALAPEQVTITLHTERGVFVGNGERETAGVIVYTRVGQGRLSGRFEARLRNREHADTTIGVAADFDVAAGR